MRIFVLASRFPYPTERGDKLRLYNQLKVLVTAYDYEIFLYAINHKLPSKSDIFEIEKYCTSVKVHVIPEWKQVLKAGIALFSPLPVSVAIHFQKSFHQIIAEDVVRYNPDAIYCQLIRMAPYLEQIQIPKVIDFMDAYGVGMERRSKIAPWPSKWLYSLEAKRTKAYEQKLLERVNEKIIISEQDKLQILKGDEIQIIPNGIDADFFTGRNLPSERSYELGFIGNMGYLPNIDAATWIVEELIPYYSKRYHGNLKVLLSGARPSKAVLQLEYKKGVKVTGWVDDIRSSYGQIKILCAPLFYGTGQQNKILEAMSMGVPCITTSAVNNAIGAEHGKQIWIADDIEFMVLGIRELLNNARLHQEISSNARSFVIEHYSWKASVSKINAIFARTKSTK